MRLQYFGGRKMKKKKHCSNDETFQSLKKKGQIFSQK